MGKNAFCTCFDHRFVDRGLVLHESLRRYLPDATLYVLALSDECEEFLSARRPDGVVVVPLKRVLSREPRLRDIRESRTHTEFIFTLTPFIVCETLRALQQGEQAVYLDADMMFFGSPEEFLDRSAKFDVAITPHNFSEHMRSQARYGIYNVGWVGFKKSCGGERCARWWADQCLAWCYDRLEDGKFADQKYLESFEKVADSVLTSTPAGLNSAPWNASGRSFQHRSGKTYVDEEPLILYHFAKVSRVRPWCLAPRIRQQAVIGARGLLKNVYQPYAKALEDVSRRYSIPGEWIAPGAAKRSGNKHRKMKTDENPGILQLITGLVRGEYVASSIPHRPWRSGSVRAAGAGGLAGD